LRGQDYIREQQILDFSEYFINGNVIADSVTAFLFTVIVRNEVIQVNKRRTSTADMETALINLDCFVPRNDEKDANLDCFIANYRFSQ
jgi:hypothetical protein